MITFVRLIKLDGQSFDIRTDSITDINTLLDNQVSFDVRFVVEVEASGSVYKLDLGKLLLKEVGLLPAANIRELVSHLTPEMLYSYQTDVFTPGVIRTFSHTDLPGEIVISPYNIRTGEEATTTYDPGYQDAVIRCSGYNLTKVFPIIDGKIWRSSWFGGNICIKGGVKLARSTHYVHFISFAETVFEVKEIAEMASLDWEVVEGMYPVVVIDGALYTGVDIFVYQFDVATRKLRINPAFIDQHYAKAGYDSAADMLLAGTTFVILLEGDRMRIREIPMVPMTKMLPMPYVYFDENASAPVDYVCIGSVSRHILNMLDGDDKYINPLTLEGHVGHHVYVDTLDSNVRLIQMAAC